MHKKAAVCAKLMPELRFHVQSHLSRSSRHVFIALGTFLIAEPLIRITVVHRGGSSREI
jgi:hypothetical protein